ncbi:hypothetical protein [uncultured Tateyamaria sp.]|uniref:hypothetical protein n=1 Tax=Tateyamaria sp. 1078 TaxID=3417464 RepID=UPI00262DFE3C|nr:hypothetical protein [uncultured Tateyamaria sp.]
MQVLIIDEKTDRRDRTMMASLERNIFATATANLAVGEEALTRLPVDVLVASADAFGDALGDLLGLAEERNTSLTTVLWSQNVGWDMDTLAEAFPTLCAVLGTEVTPELAIRIGLSGAQTAMTQQFQPTSARAPFPVPEPRGRDLSLPSAAELLARSAA